MNIIVLHNNYPFSSFTNRDEVVFYTLPETAQQKNGKPVFLPDFARPAHLELHLAVRISRLGRCISQRFAHRYYNAVAAIPHFFSPQLLEHAQAQQLPWTAAMGFDGAMPIERFVEISSDKVQQQKFHLMIDGVSVIEGDSSQMICDVDRAIAHVSQYFTLRRGDILLTGSCQPPIAIDISHRIETFVGDEKVISFNLK